MRKAKIERKTKETDIVLEINLDGKSEIEISTGIEFFDHMLCAFGTHAGFDLKIKAKGDLGVDCHHTVEDVGIVLGKAIKEAAGDKKGICRFCSCDIPMDEALSFCAVDISGRPFLLYEAEFRRQFCGDYETDLTEEFMRALATNAEITMHLICKYGKNDHHKTESLYKAAARAIRGALSVCGNTIPSSKGVL